MKNNNNRFLTIGLALSLLVPSFAIAQESPSLKDRTLNQLNAEMRLIRAGTKAALKKAQFKKLTEKESQDLASLSKRVGVVIGLLGAAAIIAGTASTARYFYNKSKKAPQPPSDDDDAPPLPYRPEEGEWQTRKECGSDLSGIDF